MDYQFIDLKRIFVYFICINDAIMARFFSFEEIRDNNLPRWQDYMDIGELIRNSIINERSVLAASFFGSFSLGTFSPPRSDMDILIITSYKRHLQAQKLLSHISQRAQEKQVPVEFVSIRSNIAKQGLSTIGPLMLSHIRRTQERGVIKGDPTSYIKPSKNMQQEVFEYLTHKLSRLEKYPTLCMDERQKLLVLQKLIDSPIHATRKLLELALQNDNAELINDSKIEVIRMSEQLQLPGLQILLSVYRAGQHYDKWLKKNLGTVHRTQRSEYLEMLSDIYSLHPLVNRLLYLYIKFARKLISGKNKD